MAKSPLNKSPLKPSSKEAPPISLQPQLQFVRVARPKNIVTTVNDVDDIDVRDGSLLLLKCAGNGRETCMVVFSPGQWISVNVDPV
jgi:hypothetical protein